jgi:hypothetical protein
LTRVIVFGNIPEKFSKTVEEFYCQAFKAYQVINKPHDQEADMSVDGLYSKTKLVRLTCRLRRFCRSGRQL